MVVNVDVPLTNCVGSTPTLHANFVATLHSIDVFSTKDGQAFVWDSYKAAANLRKHGIRFDGAREVFFDQLARYEDASTATEVRQLCIGYTSASRLLCVVHVVREHGVLRIISARPAEPSERRRYEDV